VILAVFSEGNEQQEPFSPLFEENYHDVVVPYCCEDVDAFWWWKVAHMLVWATWW
jgi:hypothetical protein